jgi:hypothetical protein
MEAVERDARAGFEEAVGDGEGVVEDGVVGEVAHGEVVELRDGAGVGGPVASMRSMVSFLANMRVVVSEGGARPLIFGWQLDVVNHEHGDGAFGGFEFESELFLNCREDVGGRIGRGIGVGGSILRGPLEGDVEAARDAGPVDDGAAEGFSEVLGEDFNAVVAADDVDAAFVVVDRGAVGLGRGELGGRPWRWRRQGCRRGVRGSLGGS